MLCIEREDAAILNCDSLEFRVTTTIFEPTIPQPDSDADIESAVAVELTATAGDTRIQHKHVVSIWSHTLLELMDLAICVDTISQRDDTTERLMHKDETEGYSHRAHWAIYEKFFDVGVLLYSKNAKRFMGSRVVELLLPPDGAAEQMRRSLVGLATPSELAQFGDALRNCYLQVVVASLDPKRHTSSGL